jgi:Protein of unknown function (DUF4232)
VCWLWRGGAILCRSSIAVMSGLLLASTACASATPQAAASHTSPAPPSDSHPAAPATTAARRASESNVSTSPPGDEHLGGHCARSQLRLRLDEPVNGASGQLTLVVALVNSSPQPCQLKGYPEIVLLDPRGQVLPFDYRHGASMMLTDVPPRSVTVLPGKKGYFAINKYRCDLGGDVLVSSMWVRLPGLRLHLSLPVKRGFGSYCGLDAPGSIVAISPVATDAGILHR